MKESFIKLHKKMLNWEWYSEPNTKSLFLHLLIISNYKDKEWKGQTIKRGQCVIGRKQLSKTLGMSEQQIRTSLDRLKSTNEITTKVTNKYTIVTVENYSSYQSKVDDSNQQNNQQNNQQITTPKEYKNNNNIYTTEFDVFYGQYPNPNNKAQTFSNWKKATKEHGNEEILQASKNYAIETSEREKQFKKTSSNFLGRDKFYLDYLPENYKPTARPKKNGLDDAFRGM